MALPEQRQRLVAAADKALAFPDLIEPAWVAGVARQDVLAADPEPARHPDVDRIGFREPATCGRPSVTAVGEQIRGLTVERHAPLIAAQMSKLMAATPPQAREADVILFPAIDLKDGKCVRLKLGDMAAATVFNEDPAAQAKLFEAQGFSYLHVVDLD